MWGNTESGSETYSLEHWFLATQNREVCRLRLAVSEATALGEEEADLEGEAVFGALVLNGKQKAVQIKHILETKDNHKTRRHISPICSLHPNETFV